MCKKEDEGACERECRCQECGKRLCQQVDDHCRVEGHFRFDGVDYFTSCWDTRQPSGKS